MKKIALLFIASVFFGAQIFSLNLGFASLSLYRMLFVLLLGMTIYKLFTNYDFSRQIIQQVRLNQYLKVFIFWAIYAVISVIWVRSFEQWLPGTFFVVVGTLSIILVSIYMTSDKDIINMLYVVFSLIIFHNIIGWIEILFNQYFWADLDKLDQYGTFAHNPYSRIPVSIFANQNDYATLLLAGIAVTIIIFLITKLRMIKLLSLATFISSSYLMIRTDSRANILGLFVFLAVLIFIRLMRFDFNKRLIKWALVLGTIILLSIIFIPFIQQNVIEIIEHSLETTFAENRSNRTRIHLILNGFIFLFQTFGFGVGAGNVEYWMEFYGVLSTGGVVNEIHNMHNWFMEILTGYGVVIFILYLTMYLNVVKTFFVTLKYSENVKLKIISWVLFAYTIAFLISSTSSASNIQIEWQWVFWGIIIAIVNRIKNMSRVR